jgi:protein-S-isoprenylcysteine O-methyltransferase Ste14
MYEVRDASLAQRVALAGMAGVAVGIAWWLLVGGGLAIAGEWFGLMWMTGEPVRRVWLAAGFSIYYIRLLFTEFVFLKRRVSWSEAFTVGPWLLCIVVVMGIGGGTNPTSIGAPAEFGALLFITGSWTNSYAEYTRNVWKQRPENRGRLYTGGLFRYSRHPNYLGDLLSFSGLCLICGAWWTAIIPALMLAGFVFVNIPVLDSHLHDHYGEAFDKYARRTRKLIPFVY